MATLYLDLDGTLIEIRQRHYAVYADVARELGVNVLQEAEYWPRRRAGAGTADLIAEALRPRFRRLWHEQIEAPSYLALDTLHPDTMATLTALREEHRLVVVTLRHDRPALQAQLDLLGLSGLLSAVHSSGATSTTKVDLIRPVLARPAVIIGDTEEDIESARTLGLPAVCVTSGLRSPTYLAALAPDSLIEAIGELPSALASLAVAPV